VDPVTDQLLFFSGSAENRTRASGSVAKNSERDSVRICNLVGDTGEPDWVCVAFLSLFKQHQVYFLDSFKPHPL
jgi:hypothetical protein